MKWTTLSHGSCGARADRASVDPNLVWADATGFADFRRAGSAHPDPFPVIVELRDSSAAGTPGPLERLHEELLRFGGWVPAVYPRTAYPAVHYCTAWFTAAYCNAVLNDPHHVLGQMIRRFQLQLPVIPDRPRPVYRVAVPAAGGPRALSQGTLLGVIDSGCPFAHWQLRDASGEGTRVLNIWDQDADRPAYASAKCGGARPADLGYGCEVSRPQLNALMQRHCRDGVVDEDACYSEAGDSLLRERYTHGSAVLGLLAGRRILKTGMEPKPGVPPLWAATGDPASQADIVFVQTPRDHSQDSSSAALDRYLLDGLRYIIACAGDDTRRIVVNISDGSSRGTHDGESTFERAMAELVLEQAGRGRELHIVLAAGNAREERRHAQIDPAPAACPWTATLTLQLPPDNETPAYVFMRVPPGLHTPTVALKPPSAALPTSPGVNPGQSLGMADDSGLPRVGLVYPARASGEPCVAMMAFPPTGTGASVALAGRWQILLGGVQPLAEPLHFYIVLGQRNAGALPRTQQPRFVDTDESYDPSRPLRHSPDDPDDPKIAKSPIRRHGTLSSFVNAPWAPGVWALGSRMERPPAVNGYSSAGPAAGAGRRELDAWMPTDESPALLGIRAMGARSGETVRVSGTSFAAPQFARLLADIRWSPKPPPYPPPSTRIITNGPGGSPR